MEDWERESLKDLVYLQETQQLLEEEVKLAIKKPAQIVIIDRDNILNREHEHQSDTLPF
jgi:hypothetical protein